MKAVDLHTHSTKSFWKGSDGSLTPTELVNYAVEKGLAAIALSDHDTTDGIDEALAAAKGKDIEVIPAIEFSTEYDGRDIHIVGLYIDYHSQEFEKYLQVSCKDAQRRPHSAESSGSALRRQITTCLFVRYSSTRSTKTVENALQNWASAVNCGHTCVTKGFKWTPRMNES